MIYIIVSTLSEYQTTYYDDVDSNFPVITLEVLSTEDTSETFTEQIETDENETQEAGVHFLSEVPNEAEKDGDNDDTKESVRNDLLEYMIRNDGRVICKLCGEVLQSRTHWYRHKYKVHIIHPLNPTPLFQCDKCRVFFKSRKGYIGHIASRHSEDYSDSMPILTNNQAEIARETPVIQSTTVIKDEIDPEMSIPKTSVPNFQPPSIKIIRHIKMESKRPDRFSNKGDTVDKTSSEWEEQRLREEKLVADIIARVRKECEAKGDGAARKGYSRRTTVMHT
ncbi:unnamed protein product [Pieris brassicae]|uniref:C2H2-type domain-containing protein n=1 Tax=Pieris brassicae TaxID=7116 RepID=A0A9P0T6S7_PIEBR|nr:unnamed protein product [Pieris brassicae]